MLYSVILVCKTAIAIKEESLVGAILEKRDRKYQFKIKIRDQTTKWKRDISLFLPTDKFLFMITIIIMLKWCNVPSDVTSYQASQSKYNQSYD